MTNLKVVNFCWISKSSFVDASECVGVEQDRGTKDNDSQGRDSQDGDQDQADLSVSVTVVLEDILNARKNEKSRFVKV